MKRVVLAKAGSSSASWGKVLFDAMIMLRNLPIDSLHKSILYLSANEMRECMN
jgi:hypothetical protein